MILFKPISFEDKKIFDHYFRQRRYEGSECTFTNLYMWRKCFNIEWALVDDFLCVKACVDDATFVLPPFPINDAEIKKPILKLMEYFRQNDQPFLMRAVSPQIKTVLEEQFSNKFIFSEERDVYDYVYLAQDLIDLKGRRYHRKRNHIKNFKKNYSSYQYLPLTEDLLEPSIVKLKEWCKKKGCEENESLLCERDAIIEAFERFSELNYIGGVILIDNKVEAFTFGEALNNDTVIIHAEKANIDIKGIYPTINQEFLQKHWQHMKYVNREEDMGDEGLRKAKLSYFPVKMVVKYKATIQE